VATGFWGGDLAQQGAAETSATNADTRIDFLTSIREKLSFHLPAPNADGV
jgi:hypothetical protein